MNRCLPGALLALAFVCPLLADDPETAPAPAAPAPAPEAHQSATEPVIEPSPKMVAHFQDHLALAKKMPQIDLVFDGDSITDFWMTVGKPVWDQRYARLNAMDFGISADKTQNLLWRLQNHQVDNLHPKLVVLLIGTNNLSGNTNEEIVAGIKAILQEYQQRCPEAAILLLGILPRGVPTIDPHHNRDRIKAINQTLSGLADGGKVLYLDIGEKFLNPDGTVTTAIKPDHLHPSPEGYQVWADAIQPVIDQFFPPAAP